MAAAGFFPMSTDTTRPDRDPDGHVPVLVPEVLSLLDPRPGEIVVDCTLGRGGHALSLAEAVAPSGLVIGIDLDPANLQHATDRLSSSGHDLVTVRGSFAQIEDHLQRLDRRADVVLADLGVCSCQLDDPARGLSFDRDGPLDMRLDPEGPVTAAELVDRCDERELADMIRRFGEDPLASRIARKLARIRRTMPIQTTAQLAQVVREAYGARSRTSRMHPATRTFQALRIVVNDELGALEALLDAIVRGAERTHRGGWLRPGGRIGVIAFHSLEDRPVKRTFAELAQRGLATRRNPSPTRPTRPEISANPRARSAKFRVLELAHD